MDLTQQGNFSHFVLALNEKILAFEERRPTIMPQSFVGAMRKLFRETDYNFDIRALPREQGFDEWKKTVDRIIAFKGTFERPNPQWLPRTEQIRDFLNSTHADKIAVDVKVEEDDKKSKSLNLDDRILDGIVEHTTTGYAQFKATGTSAGRPLSYNSEEDYIIANVEESPDDESQMIFSRLITALKERFGSHDGQ